MKYCNHGYTSIIDVLLSMKYCYHRRISVIDVLQSWIYRKQMFKPCLPMDKQPVFFCVCSQKGGVGKSTFTILLASWLHYALGRDVLVVDCDAPQWSIVAQRERELDVLERNDRYKLMMVRLFKRTGRKIWPVVRSTPDEGLQAARAYLAAGDREADFVLLDLPGTVAAPGIFRLLAQLDHLFIPLKADKLVLESALSFARAVDERLVHNDAHRLKGLHLFWTMVDRRERTPLYESYGKAFAAFRLPVLQTQVPYRSRFSKEILDTSGAVGRSTLFPADRAFAADAALDALAAEILSLME